ncbi:hypothetical protein [Escherichia coli]|uniref:hypothetical protein n=1 Tax=Escherichia coli TaxID=562 RepID=UPI001CA729A4|nr:hypothetical protein [Escherichia coli]QZY67674.1 hypothetical protein K7X33_16400 [Escherichia coli]
MSVTNPTKAERELLAGQMDKHTKFSADPKYQTFFNAVIAPFAAKMEANCKEIAELTAKHNAELKAAYMGSPLYKMKVNAAVVQMIQQGKV